MYHNDGSEKFAGDVVVIIENNLVVDYFDYEVVGESHNTRENIDGEFDIIEQFKSSDVLKKIDKDGEYYLYFEGSVVYSHYSGPDGTEYDAEVNVDYFSTSRFE